MKDRDRDNPTIGVNPFTQSLGKESEYKYFQQSNLTKIEHADPSLHYIGDGLPKPGETEATYAGRETNVGVSPIPARADHSHDTYLRYCGSSNATGVTCPPGSTNLTLTFEDGENFLVSGSLFLLPQAGVWLVSYTLLVNRSGGGVFTGDANVIDYYVNGAVGRGVWRNSMAAIVTPNYISVADTVHYDDFFVGNQTSTVEIQYQHNDTVNHVVSIINCVILRLANAEIN